MSHTELLDQFILEARECLEVIGQRLLDVEQDPGNGELLNDLFRSVHTLKGNCGLFEFKALERVVHAGEDLLDKIRSGQLQHNAQIADALLDAMDYTAELVDVIAAEGRLPSEQDDRSQQLASALRALLTAPPQGTGLPAAREDQSLPTEAATAAPPPAWSARVPHLDEAKDPVWALQYIPEKECFYKGEDPWHLVRHTPGIMGLDVQPHRPWPEAGAFDCYECNLDFVVWTDAPKAYVEDHFRYVPDQVQWWCAHPGSQAADDPSTGLPPAMGQRAAQLWRDQIALLRRPTVAASTVRAAHRVLQCLTPVVHSGHADELLSDLSQSQWQASSLSSWAMEHSPDGPVTEDNLSTPSSPSARVSPLDSRRGASTGGESGHDNAQRVLKVSQDKIDRLMDLIGEMVVAKNALPYLATRAEDVFGQRELSREIKAQYSVINRIAEDMQHAIMQVRMLPVGTVFQRFGRLVRDLSKKLGKEVQLVIEGEDTEADKNVIESLADPLIHILRNSLDHGLEVPSVRVAAGKPALGTLKVTAHQEGDRVVLEISDDGAGIDTQRVRAKAVERGLIPEDRASALTEQEAVQLVFLPGFSTADQISDLSGRGVGMDVVRSAIERVNGAVELHSTHGVGTTIRLTLPLSMAVTNVMMIEAGGRRFGLPMDLIVETVRVHREDIHHFKQSQTTVLRGRIVPLRPLHDLLALDAQPLLNEADEHAVMVVRVGSEQVGLIVDDFHGTSDIILKPLEGVLSGLTGFAGTALMGDGSVLMILNPKELI